MAKAVAALQAKQVNRIILTRPAVEAGERLGFLPGTLNDKIDPYLRPLYDALHDMVDPDSMAKLMAAGTIEVAPLAYMRGRTINSAFIILDEAQNTSPEQMKMFLTRLGFGSKIVVTGDTSQVDLPSGTKSGLKVVEDILDGLEDVSSTSSPPPTSYATGSSARSSRSTASTTPAARPPGCGARNRPSARGRTSRSAAVRGAHEHRGPRRVQSGGRRTQAGRSATPEPMTSPASPYVMDAMRVTPRPSWPYASWSPPSSPS